MASTIVVNSFLHSLINILDPICEHIYIITSNFPENISFSKKTKVHDLKISMHFRDEKCPKNLFLIFQSLRIIFIQVKICWALIKISKYIDIVIFYVGGANLLLPVLVAKILGLNVITSAIGLGSLSYKKANSDVNITSNPVKNIFPFILNRCENIIFYLSDLIIVESRNVVNFLSLEKYAHKVFTNGARYIDTNCFKIKTELESRNNLVGYIGRLDYSKGVMNFFRSIEIISKCTDNLMFFIGGSGYLYSNIERQIKLNSCHNVELTGWISHDEVADYYNRLKLFVLPSYSEGLPTCILEAMACGTPVLSTPVGAIPDIIVDGKTGFIMENNSPECIAENILRAISSPNLEEIAKNAKELVETRFTYFNAVKNYRTMMEYL
jgi:glycosyltransferase involved in cell wall biosynthesis